MTGDRIRDVRTDRDESQEELAKALKTSQTQITRWETGKTEKMPISAIKAICEHYGVSADYLLELPKGLAWPR